MLIEFTVENYLSCQTACQFNLTARPEARPQPFIARPNNLLKVAVLYGSNASGKSNLWRAWDFMRRLVLTSTFLPWPWPRLAPVPFKLAAHNAEQPSTFNVRFVQQQIVYEYGFMVDGQRVHGEWLYTYPKGRKCLLFERETHWRTNQISTRFGTFWKGERQKLYKLVRPEALLLSVAAQFNSPTANLVWHWFNDLILLSDQHAVATAKLELSPEWVITALTYSKTTLKRLLQQVDPSIQELMIEMAISDAMATAPQGVKQAVNTRVNYRPDTSPVASASPNWETPNQIEINLLHHKVADYETTSPVLLEFAEQAAGTRKYLYLLFPLLFTFRRGGVLIVDDLASQLHPDLVLNLLELCYSPEFNPHNGQLIFTSREQHLLTNPALQREQIWIVEKNTEGATVLRAAMGK
jgi:uncharacterized protein